MAREVDLPSIKDSEKTVGISQGGTGRTSLAAAAIELGLLTANMVGVPGGAIAIRPDNTISPSLIPPNLIVDDVNVTGPTSLTIGQTGSYNISDYDSNKVYTLNAISGSVSRAGSVITYTAPALIGTSGFVVNGVSIGITITGNGIAQPSIVSPINNATNVGSSHLVTSSAFTISGSATDTHGGSDWQLSTDVNFTNILQQVTNSAGNKTSWTISNLSISSTYYVRVRHSGATLGYSAWSSPVMFTTASSFLPTSEFAKLTPVEPYMSLYYTRCKLSSDGSLLVVSESNVRKVFVYRRSNNSWTLETTLTNADTTSSFGESIAIAPDNNTIFVSAPKRSGSSSGASLDPMYNPGVVYIYAKANNLWSITQTLSVNSNRGNNAGRTICLSNDGNYLAIAAPGYTSVNDTFLYIYVKSGVSYTLQQAIVDTNAYVPSGGSSLGLVMKFNATNDMIAFTSDAAEVFKVYKRTGTVWSADSTITVSLAESQATPEFDDSLSYMYVGVPGVNTSQVDIKIYKRNGSVWTTDTTLTLTDSAYLGTVVIAKPSKDNNLLFVSLSLAAHNGISTSGLVLIVGKSGVNWDPNYTKLSSSDNISSYQFGYPLSLSDDNRTLAVIGAITNQSSINAYIYK